MKAGVRQPYPILSTARVRHSQHSGGCLEVANLLVLKTVRRREGKKKREKIYYTKEKRAKSKGWRPPRRIVRESRLRRVERVAPEYPPGRQQAPLREAELLVRLNRVVAARRDEPTRVGKQWRDALPVKPKEGEGPIDEKVFLCIGALRRRALGGFLRSLALPYRVQPPLVVATVPATGSHETPGRSPGPGGLPRGPGAPPLLRSRARCSRAPPAQ